MKIKIVIAGCRDYTNYEEAQKYIDFCISDIRQSNQIIIVSGGAKGADLIREQYAKQNGFEIERYLPDWEIYGKVRNPKETK